jgi:putative membrane protein
MSLRAFRSLQALILAGLGLFLLSRVWNGKILLYINQRFVILVFLAGLGLVILAQVIFRERPSERDRNGEKTGTDFAEKRVDYGLRWNLWWIALPVMIGLLIPARPLGASVLAMRGINTSAPLTANLDDAQYSLSLAPGDRTVLDWIRLFTAADEPQVFIGQPVDIIGFVYHDPRLSQGQFMVGRFTITCCVADALALGMIVNWPGVEGLVENTWVRVQGSLDVTELAGRTIPMVTAHSVEPVQQPEQPYLFP